MKNLIPIIAVILILVSFLPPSGGTQGTRTFEISSLIIKFDQTDAEFIVNYDIGTIPKMYILLMGGKSIEPKIKELFSNESIGLGTQIDTMTIYIPGDIRPTEYVGLNATPNKFYR